MKLRHLMVAASAAALVVTGAWKKMDKEASAPAEVKSHGSATAGGVANAVAVAARLLENKLTERIAHDLGELDARMWAGTAPTNDAASEPAPVASDEGAK